MTTAAMEQIELDRSEYPTIVVCLHVGAASSQPYSWIAVVIARCCCIVMRMRANLAVGNRLLMRIAS